MYYSCVETSSFFVFHSSFAIVVSLLIMSPFLFLQGHLSLKSMASTLRMMSSMILKARGLVGNNVMSLWSYQFNLDHLQLYEEKKTRDIKFAFPQLATVILQDL
jgi:hypothetical protein